MKRRLLAPLPRTVLALGLVSLLTDLSSEMIYPLLPAFLTTTLGASAVSLGTIEGVAEATASLLKVASGWWSDGTGKRKPLVLVGYGTSGACRPLIGFAGTWLGVLLLRFGDRVGKGLRTSPRDALIADAVAPSLRGTAFGFHRSMDHAGAVLGPLTAAGLLALGVSLRSVFLLAAVPAAAVIAAIRWGVREQPLATHLATVSSGREHSRIDPGFRRLLGAVGLFTLGNSTDAFLLLRLGEAGLSPSWVAILWSAHHGIKMASTYAGGRLSDRLGRKPLLVTAWLYYAAVYACFALVRSPPGLVALFLAYGVYYGLAEPAEKAWAADLSPEGLRGTAFGFYHGVVGLAALPASLVFGVIWKFAGTAAAFSFGAALALAASAVLCVVPDRRRSA